MQIRSDSSRRRVSILSHFAVDNKDYVLGGASTASRSRE